MLKFPIREHVPEKTSNEEVLPKQLLEGFPWKRVPGDSVRGGGEDPVELPQHCSPVTKHTGNFVKVV